MNGTTLKIVKREITRLVSRIHELEEMQKARDGKSYSWMCPKEQGAVKRASMDLTRALAEMRKPG